MRQIWTTIVRRNEHEHHHQHDAAGPTELLQEALPAQFERRVTAARITRSTFTPSVLLKLALEPSRLGTIQTIITNTLLGFELEKLVHTETEKFEDERQTEKDGDQIH